MTDLVMDMLLEKKIQEFMEYQAYVKSQLDNAVNDLFTEDVIKTIADYADINKHLATCGELWASDAQRDGSFIRLKENPNNEGCQYIDKGDKHTVFYASINNIDSLKNCVKELKRYEYLLKLINTKGPALIESVFEWKKNYIESNINYLNDLDFSIPSKKPTRYVVKILIEEVTE